jgi:DNA-binding PadR family transcriptional regulator
MAGIKQAQAGCMSKASNKRAPIMCLFFIWRLQDEPRHAYSLLKDIREIGIASLKPSAVYALLSGMEKSGLVKSHIDTSSHHARRLYRTTPKGTAYIESVKKSRIKGSWREFMEFLLS